MVVAGLSVPEKVVRVARVSRSGVVERRADVLAGAEWAHDAEISPHAVGSAVALVYRGKLEGQLQRVVVRLDDTLSQARSEAWQAATGNYSVLVRVSVANPSLASEIAPAKSFFGRKAKGSSGGGNGAKGAPPDK